MAVAHFVAVAGDDMRAGPDADGAGDLAGDDSVAKAFGEDHGYSLQLTAHSLECIVAGCSFGLVRLGAWMGLDPVVFL